jgi:hypothetical protein
MRHFKILGWLWLLFGGFWTLLIACALLDRAAITPQQPPEAIISSWAWFEGVIGNSVECSFFLGSAVLGVGLLRRWRRAHVAAAVLGAFTLAVYALLVPAPSFPPATLAQSMLRLSPLAVLGLYSLLAVWRCKYEPKSV